MTISNSQTKIIALGNGATTTFSYGFLIPYASAAQVIYTDASGVSTTLSPSLYSITGLGNPTGGSVQYPLSGSPIASGTQLTIARVLPLTQTASFSNQGAIFLSQIEASFDLLEMQLQQVSEAASRYVSAPITDPSAPLTLPAASQRANKIMAFDASGNPIAATSSPAGTISSAMAPVVSAASLPLARAAFGVPAPSVVATSADRSVTSADNQALIVVDCSAAAKTITVGAASTLGAGFAFGIRHDGTANQVKVTGNGSDLFAISGAAVTSFSLVGRGQTLWFVCDGTGFKCESDAPPLIGATTGVILIADRLATPPVSPTPGARYILLASPTGAWSSFAQQDIAEANGQGGWFKYTPAANCGWRAYVQSTSRFYSYRASAWIDDTTVGCACGLVITVTSNTALTVVCNEAYIGVNTGAVSLTMDLTTTGLLGLDTGALAGTSGYHIWLISNGVSTSAIASLSSTAPTMPAGYIYKLRIGGVRTAIGAATLLRTKQVGNVSKYVVTAATNTAALPIMASGVSGSVTVPTWTSVAVANYVIGTATRILGSVGNNNGGSMAAPNSAYGAINSSSNPPPVSANSAQAIITPFDFALEGANVFFASNFAPGFMACAGWVDAVNAN